MKTISDLPLSILVKGTLSSPTKKDTETPAKAKIRVIGEDLFQIETVIDNKAYHKNLKSPELLAWLESNLGPAYRAAHLEFTDHTADILTNKRGELTFIVSKPETGTASPVGGHNREKKYLIAEGTPVPYLVELGVMTPQGMVRAPMYDKFRQINRFVEYIDDSIDSLLESKEDRELVAVDFGCGKSYLTFAAYHYLTEIKGIKTRIIGLDLKADVIKACSLLAAKCGYEGLSFEHGDIARFTGVERADLVMTLHACDTATDMALAQAVRWGAKVILSVPCCQHEINAQLSQRVDVIPTGRSSLSNEIPTLPTGRSTGPNKAPTLPTGRSILAPLLKYGIIRERLSSLITDTLRAELLEEAGYTVQLLEFIDMSHTPKNLLIRARLRTEVKTATKAESHAKALMQSLAIEHSLDRELKKVKENEH